LLGWLGQNQRKNTLTQFDQKEDILQLFNFVKLDSKKCFEWNDELTNFVKNELGKQDPEKWIEKQKEKKVLEEPILGSLRFLVDFGGDN